MRNGVQNQDLVLTTHRQNEHSKQGLKPLELITNVNLNSMPHL